MNTQALVKRKSSEEVALTESSRNDVFLKERFDALNTHKEAVSECLKQISALKMAEISKMLENAQYQANNLSDELSTGLRHKPYEEQKRILGMISGIYNGMYSSVARAINKIDKEINSVHDKTVQDAHKTALKALELLKKTQKESVDDGHMLHFNVKQGKSSWGIRVDCRSLTECVKVFTSVMLVSFLAVYVFSLRKT